MINPSDLQPVKLFFKHNAATHSNAAIHYHTYGTQDKKRIEKAKKSKRLFKELGFKNVRVYHNMAKSQMIEKFDMMQSVVDDFESCKLELRALADELKHAPAERRDELTSLIHRSKIQVHSTMICGIVSISDSLNAEDDMFHTIHTAAKGIRKPKRSKDGTFYMSRYLITYNDEAINTTEYACRLVSGPSTFVL